jgi:hypothetical protein
MSKTPAASTGGASCRYQLWSVPMLVRLWGEGGYRKAQIVRRFGWFGAPFASGFSARSITSTSIGPRPDLRRSPQLYPLCRGDSQICVGISLETMRLRHN